VCEVCKEVNKVENLNNVEKLEVVEEAGKKKCWAGGRRLYRWAVKGLPSDFTALRRGRAGK
jgi:hypothetical protein